MAPPGMAASWKNPVPKTRSDRQPDLAHGMSLLIARPWLPFLSVITLVLFLERVYEIWISRGIFDSIAGDYAIYGATAHVVTDLGWSHLYDVQAITNAGIEYFQPYYGPTADRLKSGPSPYPALFILPFIAANWLGPIGGFIGWTVGNLLIVLVITHGMIRGRQICCVGTYLLPFVYLPILYNLFEGQLAIIMAFGIYRFYKLMVEGRDSRAGAWLGLLLLKPQFAFLLAMVLVGKGRWRALLGLSASAFVFSLSTIALVGTTGMKGYFEILRAFSGFRQVPPIVNPCYMINIRGVLVNVLPEGFDETQGTLLVFILSAVLVLSLVSIWQGSWNPRTDRFAWEMLATLIVAMFTGYHNHIHGASLLIVPMLAILSRANPERALVDLLVIAIFIPTLVIEVTWSLRLAAWSLMTLMLTCLTLILINTYQRTRRL